MSFLEAENRGRRTEDRGYILMEVMLALFIFALAVTGLIRSLGMTADSMLDSNRESQIRLALQSKLAEDRVMPVELGIKSDLSDDATVTIEHEWKQLKMANSDNIQLSDLYELAVRAKWMQGGQPRNQEAKIVLYRPQP